MKATTSLLAIIVAATLLLAGCQTPNEQSSGPFPDDYEGIVHSYVAKTFKNPDNVEWKAIHFPRQGSFWRGLIFGGSDPCWLVDVTLNTKNGSSEYVGNKTYTIFIKNDQVIGSCAIHYGPFISFGRDVSFEKLLEMSPFNATVEVIIFDHPFFMHDTSVEIHLKKPDAAMRLILQSYPANQTIIGFAHSLQEGKGYTFPEVFVEYVNSQTNKPPNTTADDKSPSPK